jgi:hypothetical protein
MAMLHPSDASLIGLYSVSTQTKMFAVYDGKTEMYFILLEPSLQGTELLSLQRCKNKRTTGLYLGN